MLWVLAIVVSLAAFQSENGGKVDASGCCGCCCCRCCCCPQPPIIIQPPPAIHKVCCCPCCCRPCTCCCCAGGGRRRRRSLPLPGQLPKMSGCNCDAKSMGAGCGAPLPLLNDDVATKNGSAAANATNPIVFGLKEGLHRGARQTVIGSKADN